MKGKTLEDLKILLNEIKANKKDELIATGTPEFIYLEKGKAIPRKDFYIKLNDLALKEIDPYIPKEGDEVKFKTMKNGVLIEDIGKVINAKWKNSTKLILIYNIRTKNEETFRVITDQDRYPHDDILKLTLN